MTFEKNALESKIFGSDGTRLICTLRAVIPNLRGSVRDWPEEVFKGSFTKSLEDGIYIYWCELLGRAYIAAGGSLIRHEQWIKGMIGAYQVESYLGLCGSLRGLLESAADSMYSLEFVSSTIAENWYMLQPLMLEKRGQQMVISTEMEERLIHFHYGRNIGKNEKEPTGHRALRNRDYIDTIRKFDPGLEALYCELVEIVHPAKESLSWTIKHKQAKDHWSIEIGEAGDSSKAISQFLDKYRGTLLNLLTSAVILPLVTLKTLRKLQIEDIDLSFMDSINLDGVRGWQKIEAKTKS